MIRVVDTCNHILEVNQECYERGKTPIYTEKDVLGLLDTLDI